MADYGIRFPLERKRSRHPAAALLLREVALGQNRAGAERQALRHALREGLVQRGNASALASAIEPRVVDAVTAARIC